MERNRLIPRGHSSVRLQNGSEPTHSTKENIPPRCGSNSSGRFGRIWRNGPLTIAENSPRLQKKKNTNPILSRRGLLSLLSRATGGTSLLFPPGGVPSSLARPAAEWAGSTGGRGRGSGSRGRPGRLPAARHARRPGHELARGGGQTRGGAGQHAQRRRRGPARPEVAAASGARDRSRRRRPSSAPPDGGGGGSSAAAAGPGSRGSSADGGQEQGEAVAAGRWRWRRPICPLSSLICARLVLICC